MASPYRIVLTDDQRAELRTLIGAGVAPARMLTRARILLKADLRCHSFLRQYGWGNQGGAMSRRTYSDEFKREAVALVETGRTVEQVALQLGVPNGTLWNWVKRTRERVAHGKPDGMTGEEWDHSSPYQAALRRIAELERENEFLGKASASFAQKGHRERPCTASLRRSERPIP